MDMQFVKHHCNPCFSLFHVIISFSSVHIMFICCELYIGLHKCRLYSYCNWTMEIEVLLIVEYVWFFNTTQNVGASILFIYIDK